MSIIEEKTYPTDFIRKAEASDEIARLYLSAVKRGQMAESELVEAGYYPIESNGRLLGYKLCCKSC